MLGAAGGAPLSPVQLQKSLFLIGENLKPADTDYSQGYYAFEPYDYGPFDSDVYADAEALAATGLATITPHPARSFFQYAATPEGVARASELEKSIPPVARQYVHDVVAWARDRSFSEIVRAIYQKYPKQRARSVFNG